VKFGKEERTYFPLIPAKFHLDRSVQRIAPAGRKTEKSVLYSKNNTGRAALRAVPAGNEGLLKIRQAPRGGVTHSVTMQGRGGLTIALRHTRAFIERLLSCCATVPGFWSILSM